MSGELVVGFVSIGVVVVVNLVVSAYHYGRLNQTVIDLCKRVDRIESGGTHGRQFE